MLGALFSLFQCVNVKSSLFRALKLSSARVPEIPLPVEPVRRSQERPIHEIVDGKTDKTLVAGRLDDNSDELTVTILAASGK